VYDKTAINTAHGHLRITLPWRTVALCS